MTIEPIQAELMLYSNIFFMIAFPILTVLLLIVAIRFLNYIRHVSFELDYSTKIIRSDVAQIVTKATETAAALKVETEAVAESLRIETETIADKLKKEGQR